MTDPDLNADFWDERYLNNHIQWDLGGVSPPLKAYFDQLTDKNIEILIPGAGNGWEAEYLYKLGFKNVFIVDFSPLACQQFSRRIPEFPEKNIFCTDFFELEGQYDLIVEQTFFCALEPRLREAYVQKMRSLLKPGGKLVGLLFDDELNDDQPPFGGCREEYLELFQPWFKISTMEKCLNSIRPRSGRELFIRLEVPRK